MNSKVKLMKRAFGKVVVVGLVCVLSAAPLRAQTRVNAEAPADSKSAETERRMAQDKLENERRMALDKLETEKTIALNKADAEKAAAINKTDAEKAIAINKTDAEKAIAINRKDKQWGMIHDLAWNSWILVVIAYFGFSYLKARRRHETIRLMVEKGIPVTPEVLAGLRHKEKWQGPSYDRSGYLRWGILLVAIGVGVLIVAGKAGWIVILIGLANLIMWMLEIANRSGSTNSSTSSEKSAS
jgi:hypothetical protein